MLAESAEAQKVAEEFATVGDYAGRTAAEIALDGIRRGTLTSENMWVVRAIAEQEQTERQLTETQTEQTAETVQPQAENAQKTGGNAQEAAENVQPDFKNDAGTAEQTINLLKEAGREQAKYNGLTYEVVEGQNLDFTARVMDGDTVLWESVAEKSRGAAVRALQQAQRTQGFESVENTAAETGSPVNGNIAEREEPKNTAEQRDTEGQIAELAEQGRLEIPGEDGTIALHLQESRRGGAVATVTREGQTTVLFEGDTIENAARKAVEYAKGEQNGGQGTRAGGERTVGLGADERAGSLEGEAGQNQSRTGSGRGAGTQSENRRRAAENLGVARSSPREYGIVNGTNEKTAIFIKYGESKEANRLINSDAELSVINFLAKARGQEVVFFAGLINLEMEDGSIMEADGIQQGNRIFVRIDSNTHSARGIYDHEDTHFVIEANGGQRGELFKSLSAQLKNLLTDKYGETYEKYRTALPDSYTELDILEEMLCDAGGRMNNFTDDEELSDTVRKAVSENRKNRRASEENHRSKASFAGRQSKTANTGQLTQAEQMEQQNIDADTIRQETGWFRGADGEWRYEIDDSRARISLKGDARFRQKHPGYARYIPKGQ